jgi:hypothetical protein
MFDVYSTKVNYIFDADLRRFLRFGQPAMAGPSPETSDC